MKTSLPNTFLSKSYITKPIKLGWWSFFGLIIGALISLLIFAPAAWLSYLIAKNTNQYVQLLNTTGTVWNGNAELVLTGGINSKDKAQLPGHIYWKINPRLTNVNATLFADCCMSNEVQLNFGYSWNKLVVKLENSEIRLPAAMLSALGAPWNTLGLQAVITLSHDQLTFELSKQKVFMQGNLSILIDQASSKLSTIRPLGSYSVEIKGGEQPTLNLITNEGSLILSGTGQWSGNRLRFTGEASATPESEQALGNLLNIIGRRTGSRSIITLG
jgi:general secretion pathway protein N